MLTDSGGFQVFSLSGLRKITEEGVTFASHIDGRRIFMGPEESMRIQSNLGSDIAMAFDECIENPAPREYVQQSVERTYRWLERCVAEHQRLNRQPDCVNPARCSSASTRGVPTRTSGNGTWTRSPSCPATASPSADWRWGESTQTMYDIIDAVEPRMPGDKPRYLMGVGTPSNIIERWPGGWTSSTASCPPGTPATASCIPGGGPSTSKREVQAGPPAHRPGVPVPRLPVLLPGLPAPSGDGGGDAGHASGGAAQPALL